MAIKMKGKLEATALLSFLLMIAMPHCLFCSDLRQEEDKLTIYLEANEIMNQAITLFADKNYEDAKERFEQVLQSLPNHAEARFYLGCSHYSTNDYQAALVELSRAIESYPEWQKYKYDRETEHYHYAQSRIIELQNELRQMLGDGNYNAYMSGGLKGLHSVPKEDAARVINIQRELTAMKEVVLPKSANEEIPAPYYLHTGNCYLRLKKYNEAFENYQRAVQADPKLAEAHHNLALIYYMAKQYENSWKHLELAKQYGAKTNPDFEKALKEKLGK
jgi:protein O-GlcNAc transferase